MMQFDWTLRPESEWRELCKKVPRLNMLQSLPFERAAWMLDKKLTRRAVITIDNEPAGIMAIQEIHLDPCDRPLPRASVVLRESSGVVAPRFRATFQRDLAATPAAPQALVARVAGR